MADALLLKGRRKNQVEGSSPSRGTNMEMWPSLAYGNSLENCRVERHREFESHRFRQDATMPEWSKGTDCKPVKP